MGTAPADAPGPVATSSPLSFKDITALELSCMAEYGGPVFPYIALGGYPGTGGPGGLGVPGGSRGGPGRVPAP